MCMLYVLLCLIFFFFQAEDGIRDSQIDVGRDSRDLPLGTTWVQQFIGRHSQLKTVISQSIEAARITDVTTEVIINFFKALEVCMKEYNITTENMYNMDETGQTFHLLQELIVGFAI